MNALFMLATLVAYFLILMFISYRTSRRGAKGNDAFFRAGRQSPWWMVAFGMIGTSISGVTFISVPGWAKATGLTYLQMCMGFVVGYIVVALVLLPLYYKLRLTSIYTYLVTRFGNKAHGTGALFFVLSKLTGASARLYLVCLVLQRFVVAPFGGEGIVAFVATGIVVLLLIWLYTHRSGIRTLVWTDTLQTAVLLFALLLIIMKVCSMLHLNLQETVVSIWNDPHSRMFEFADLTSKQTFWKQFLSGIFVVIVMTGLDQDMMQKNLTCKSLRAAQKDMCSYGLMFVPVNLLFLALGVLLLHLYAQQGIPLPNKGDDLLSGIVMSGALGDAVVAVFGIGVVASAFSSADSAMTALTTSFCVDIMQRENDEKHRKLVHIGMMVAFLACTLAFNELGSGSVMDLIYTLVSYTYGPLLGLFAFGMFTKYQVRGSFVPYIAIASPIVCYIIDYATLHTTGYKFGYEMLMFNGMLTFTGLWAVRCGK